jgi:LVIVD repeat
MKIVTLTSGSLAFMLLAGIAVSQQQTPQPAQATPPAATQQGGNRGANAGARPTPPPPPPAVMPPPVTPIVSMTPPNPDPRVGLAPGRWDAGQAAWNMRMISTTPPSDASAGATHSDLAFTGKYAIQGSYNGFEIWDISNPAKPVLANAYTCPASQNDVSVYKNLLFMSSEATNSRQDCQFGGVPEPASENRVRGIRIFDITDIAHPKLVTSVQTCRGSHTHTVVSQANDPNNVYIYVSGTARVRPGEELKGCKDGGRDDPDSARFRLEVIKVPLAKPGNAAIVSSPRIFNNLPVAPGNEVRAKIDEEVRKAAEAARAEAVAKGDPDAIAAQRAEQERRNAPPSGPNQCHDITVYPQIGLAGGACAGLGLLLDIHDAAHPFRIDMAGDSNMSFWHSATFNNDGTKVLFSDEWGGGGQPRCRASDKPEWGADALFTIENKNLVFHSYYKMPAAQTNQENCVAHNGSLIPIPGRDVMVQAFYQGGITIFDWTDVSHPKEIAFFDRGPIDPNRLVLGGSWSAYWYNGLIVSSEIARGLDIFELLPSGLITQNEIDAAKTVHFDSYNTQDQQKFVWPPSFALAKAYLDQLERSKGLDATKLKSARDVISGAEHANTQQRRTALTQLAAQLNTGLAGSTDQPKLKLLAAALSDLAKK